MILSIMKEFGRSLTGLTIRKVIVLKRVRIFLLSVLLLAATVFLLASCSADNYKKQLYTELTDNYVEATGFTSSSYKGYESAYLAARKIYEREDATAAEVREAIDNLEKAKKGLVKTADFSQLILAIDTHEKIIPTMYTEESYLRYLSVYESALAVYEDDTSGQSTINAAVKALNEAIAGLVEVGDTSSLEILVQNHIEKGNYTSASYRQYEEAYANALQLLKKENATKDEMLLAFNFLNQAIIGLQEKGDITQLVSAYNSMRTSCLITDDAGRTPDMRYTSGSYNKLMVVAEKVKSAISTGDISMDKVTELITELNDAEHSLVDLSQLLDRVDQLSKYTSNDLRYTEESYSALLAAFQNGITVASSAGATVEQVENAVAHIDGAIEALEYRKFIPDGRTDKDLLFCKIKVGKSTTTIYDYLQNFGAFFTDVCEKNAEYAYYTDDTSGYVTYGKCTLTMSENRLNMVYKGTALMSEKEEQFFSIVGVKINSSIYDLTASGALGTPTSYINGSAEGGSGASVLTYFNAEAGVKLVIRYDEKERCMVGFTLTLDKTSEPVTPTETPAETDLATEQETPTEQENADDGRQSAGRLVHVRVY